MNTIPLLQPGDTVAIVAPAKAIEAELVDVARRFFESRGFTVTVSAHCTGNHHYFSGTRQERLDDFAWALQNPDIKAIICARGGYGCVQLVDDLPWDVLNIQPKWVVGFSDVTVFHSRLSIVDFPSIHATMPLNYSVNTQPSLDTLLQALTSPSYSVSALPHPNNIDGSAAGTLIGGNLSVLYSLLGTNDEMDYREKILFIEDLAEHLYAIDRMLYAFRKAGIFNRISGLVVGGMTDLKDTAVPFGSSVEEIILSHCSEAGIPVAFGFPSGHQDHNLALRFGNNVSFSVDYTGAHLHFGQ